MWTLRVAIAALCAALVLASLSAAPAAQDAGTTIRDLLVRRATALLRGDSATFEETMRHAPPDFARREKTRFNRLRTLPLSAYEYVIEDDEFGDLARAKDRAGFDEARVVQVTERIALRGYDTKPAGEEVFLTVARKGSSWSVVADDAVEDLGLLSNRGLWDFGEIQRVERDGIMVVFHPSERGAVDAIISQARGARARVRRDWPFRWDDPIVIMVPSTVGELERILQTTFELTQFVAFAASSVDRSKGYDLGGNRIFLHWPNFRKYSASFQTSILAHEFLHLATRDMAGPYITAIFDEGVAQHYGEGGGETEIMRRRIRGKTLPGSLVPDWFFLAGPRDDIFLAYEEAASFVRYLTRRFGRNAGANAYKALGEIDPITPGTWRYHLDRVFQRLFKQPYPALERGWFDTVSKELG